jgi:hypothetical protein
VYQHVVWLHLSYYVTFSPTVLTRNMVPISWYAAVFILTPTASAPTEEAKIWINFTWGGNYNFGHLLLLAVILQCRSKEFVSISVCLYQVWSPIYELAAVCVSHVSLSLGAKLFTLKCVRVNTFVPLKWQKYSQSVLLHICLTFG